MTDARAKELTAAIRALTKSIVAAVVSWEGQTQAARLFAVADSHTLQWWADQIASQKAREEKR